MRHFALSLLLALFTFFQEHIQTSSSIGIKERLIKSRLEALKAHIRKYPEAYPKSAPGLDAEQGGTRDA